MVARKVGRKAATLPNSETMDLAWIATWRVERETFADIAEWLDLRPSTVSDFWQRWKGLLPEDHPALFV